VRPFFFAVVALAAGAGCGYVGDPLPPALNIPQRISDLKAVEVGDRIEIEFTLPTLTTEGIILKTLGGVDLRAGKAANPFEADKWAETAKVIEMSSELPGRVKKSLSAKEWAGQEIFIGVRAMNANGRTSGWSNFVSLTVVAPMPKPVVTAASDPEGLKLQWTGGSAPVFRVFRKAPNDKEPVQLAEVRGANEYIDKTAEYGTQYLYSVVAVNGEARSDMSEPREFTSADTFAPSVPGGVQAIVGVDTVELAWERVMETDLRGYRVYRMVEGAEWERLTDLVDVPTFSDKSPAAGKKAAYAVSSLDIRGNESGRSGPVEIAVP
jgi:hypothetical protein